MADDVPEYVTAQDAAWLWNIIAGTLILLMQLGFALLEAGSIHRKSAANIFFKNVADLTISALAWLILGYALTGLDSAGDNGFIGGYDSGAWFNVRHGDFAFWFFQFSFCATTATIVSGSIAERARLEAYMVFVFIMSGFVYPVVVHWAWDEDGFLFKMGYADFAGSGVVHMVGGIMGLVAAIFVGPRAGRFESGFLNSCLKHDLSVTEGQERSTFQGHSIPFQVMGAIVLFVGWLGFNPGSTGAVAGNMDTAALCAVNTVVGAAGGCLATLFLGRVLKGYFDIGLAVNGLLAGLVAVTAGCNMLMPPIALGVGVLGGLVYYGASRALEALEIDDPLDAFPVHGAAGFTGVLVLAILPKYNADNSLEYSYHQILPQLVGLAAIVAWSLTWAVAIFGTLHLTGFLRASKEAEEVGLDQHDHRVSSYVVARTHKDEMANVKVELMEKDMPDVPESPSDAYNGDQNA